MPDSVNPCRDDALVHADILATEQFTKHPTVKPVRLQRQQYTTVFIIEPDTESYIQYGRTPYGSREKIDFPKFH